MPYRPLHCLLAIGVMIASANAAQTPPPWIGVHIDSGGRQNLDRIARSLPGLAKLGVNALVLEVGYHLEFASHPELNAADAIGREQARAFGDLCRANHIRIIPSLNCL